MMYIKFLILALCLVFSSVLAKSLEGQVIKVSDGDTIWLQTKSNKKHKIRVAEIDAPELSQPYGQKAQQALSSLILFKTVRIEYKIKDKYKRIVGHVYLNNLDVGAEMVRQGHVWVYKYYSDSFYLYSLEYWARLNHKGLWALPSEKRIAPWEWRRSRGQRKNLSKIDPLVQF